MTALSEQRLRALVMFMAASRESLNGYYGKVFEGDTNKVTINNIDASWGRFLDAVVPELETRNFDADERAKTISKWYQDEFKLADAPASYRGSSQQEASYRAIVARGIGELAGLIAQELEHDKTQAEAIEPLKQLAEESKQHALAFKELAKDGNRADEQQTTEKWTEFFEQHTNPSDYPFFRSKLKDSKPNPQKQPLNTATERTAEAFKKEDLEFTAINLAADEKVKSQDILEKLKNAKSDIGGTFQLIRLLGVPVLSNEQAVSNIFETATGRKPHKMITTVVAKVAGFLKGADNLQHNFMAHLPHFGKQRS